MPFLMYIYPSYISIYFNLKLHFLYILNNRKRVIIVQLKYLAMTMFIIILSLVLLGCSFSVMDSTNEDDSEEVTDETTEAETEDVAEESEDSDKNENESSEDEIANDDENSADGDEESGDESFLTEDVKEQLVEAGVYGLGMGQEYSIIWQECE